MSDQNPQQQQPTTESLQRQLTELNNRSRWYSSELWQIPFAYLGVTGVALAQLAAKASKFLGVGFAVSAGFGFFVIIHVFRIRASEQRAIGHLQETEAALHLPPTALTGQGRPKIFQIAVVVAVLGYAAAAVYFLTQ